MKAIALRPTGSWRLGKNSRGGCSSWEVPFLQSAPSFPSSQQHSQPIQPQIHLWMNLLMKSHGPSTSPEPQYRILHGGRSSWHIWGITLYHNHTTNLARTGCIIRGTLDKWKCRTPYLKSSIIVLSDTEPRLQRSCSHESCPRPIILRDHSSKSSLGPHLVLFFILISSFSFSHTRSDFATPACYLTIRVVPISLTDRCADLNYH